LVPGKHHGNLLAERFNAGQFWRGGDNLIFPDFTPTGACMLYRPSSVSGLAVQQPSVMVAQQDLFHQITIIDYLYAKDRYSQ
jgi:hypothetical protein